MFVSTNFHIITGSGKAKEDMLAFNAFYHDLATKIMDDEKIMTSFRVLLCIPYFTAQLKWYQVRLWFVDYMIVEIRLIGLNILYVKPNSYIFNTISFFRNNIINFIYQYYLANKLINNECASPFSIERQENFVVL